MKQTQKAGTYSLIKGVVQQRQISSLMKALNKDTNQIWHAKIFNSTLLIKQELEKNLDFLVQMLMDGKEKDYIICINEIFTKNDSTFIIQELYDTTLPQLVAEKAPLPSTQIEDVLRDILAGLLELYQINYFTRSLRPDHIVCVDDVWKIESVVFNTQVSQVESEIIWSRRFSSPEEKELNGQIEAEKVDEQLVWQLGMLGLYMLLGENYDYEGVMEAGDINWEYVEQNTSQALYQLLRRCLHTDFAARIRIRQLLALDIFSNLDEINGHKFLSLSKFYIKAGDLKPSPRRQVPPLHPQDQRILRRLKHEIEDYRYFSEVNKYTQSLPYRNYFDLNFVVYLSYRICRDNLKQIKQKLLNWPKVTKNLQQNVEYIHMLSSISQEISMAEQNVVKYSKTVEGTKIIKSEIKEIKQSLDIEVRDEDLRPSKVEQLYLLVASSIYTLLLAQCNDKSDELKERHICYYSMAVYLLNFNSWQQQVQKLEAYQRKGIPSAAKFIEQAPINTAVEFTQLLIRNHFIVAEQTKRHF